MGRQEHHGLTMPPIKIHQTIEAEQWTGEPGDYPTGCYETLPEICWSHGRELVYFTYGTLRPGHWMGVEKLAAEPKQTALDGWVGFTPKDGAPKYWRSVLPFAFWEVKSEAQMKNRAGEPNAYAPIFLTDDSPADEIELFHNYCSVEHWPNPLPRFAEYREVNGKYGRGYAPHYLGPGDWLVREPGREPRVITDAEMQALRAA